MGKMVGVAEFKAKCSELLRELEAGGGPITITNRGKVVGVLTPPLQEAPRGSLFGLMKGTVTFAPEHEPDEMVDPDWGAKFDAKWDERGFPAPDADRR